MLWELCCCPITRGPEIHHGEKEQGEEEEGGGEQKGIKVIAMKGAKLLF